MDISVRANQIPWNLIGCGACRSFADILHLLHHIGFAGLERKKGKKRRNKELCKQLQKVAKMWNKLSIRIKVTLLTAAVL